MEPLRPISFRGAAIVGLLAVVLRLVVMAAPPRDLDYAGHVWVEEFLRGNIAWEVLHGPVIPLQDHQIPFWGGMLVVGLMAVPTFAVLGPTLFALRLATLPFSFLFAAAGFLLLDRLVSRRAAWIGGLLLALAPPGLVYTSVLAQGTHCEQTAIGLLLLWLYAEHVKRGLSSLRLAFAVGLVFGFHVTFGAAQILPLLLLFDFARDKLFFLRKEFAARAAGILIGALPFLRYEIVSGGEAHKNYDYGPLGMITPHSLSDSLDKLGRLPFEDFPRSFWFEESRVGGVSWMGIAATVALVALYAVALHAHRAAWMAWLRALVAWKRGSTALDPVALVLALPAVWLVLYALTPLSIGPLDWIIGYRYLLVPQAFLFLTAAIGADVLWSRGKAARRALTLGLSAWLFACTVATIVRCDFAHASELRAVPGARPEGVARVVLWKHGTAPGPLASFLDNVRARRSGTEQDALDYELASLLRMHLAQLVRANKPPLPDRDPRAALALAREHVAEPFRAWFEVPETGLPDLLPTRRPDFGVTPHGD